MVPSALAVTVTDTELLATSESTGSPGSGFAQVGSAEDATVVVVGLLLRPENIQMARRITIRKPKARMPPFMMRSRSNDIFPPPEVRGATNVAGLRGPAAASEATGPGSGVSGVDAPVSFSIFEP